MWLLVGTSLQGGSSLGFITVTLGALPSSEVVLPSLHGRRRGNRMDSRLLSELQAQLEKAGGSKGLLPRPSPCFPRKVQQEYA